MQTNCPHCQSSVDIVESANDTLVCPSCGSTFQDDATKTSNWEPSKGTELTLGSEAFSTGSVTDTPDEIPEQIGRFEIRNRLGMGAFGVVYHAHDPNLAREVAIKVPRGGNMLSGEELTRFLREARSVSTLQHASIVPVFEVGEIDSVPYIVSELVVGKPLSSLLSKGLPNPRQAANWAISVAAALHHAHDRGIVHRDVKPSNILVEKTSKLAKLMDFGLARRNTGEASVTVDGQVLGTPAYMSPEQAAGQSRNVDCRSDVYSLGATLYVLLTNELPFRGNQRMLMHQVLNEEPRSPRSLNDRVPVDLETISLKAMAKQPARRYANAEEMEQDLQRWLDGEPIQARPVTRIERFWRRCKRNPLVTGLTAGIVILLITATIASTMFSFHYSQLATSENEARKDAEAKRKRAVQLADESRDRLNRLYVANGIRRAEEGDPALALPWIVEALRLSPKGSTRQELHRIRLGTILRQQPLPKSIWFLDDAAIHIDVDRANGRIAVANVGRHGQVFDLATGKAITPKLPHKHPVLFIQFSPDGKQVATASADSTARLWDAETGKPLTPPLKHTNQVPYLTFHPTRPELLTCSWDKSIRRWDTRTGKAIGKPLLHGGRVNMAEYDPAGKRIVSASEDKHAYIWNLDDRSSKPIKMEHSHFVWYARFSPDGSLVATSCHSYEVQIFDAKTGQAKFDPIPHGGPVRFIQFNRRGNRLVSCSEDHTARIWNTADGKPVAPPLRHAATVSFASFSPDSKRVLTGSADGTARVWDVETGAAQSPPMHHNSALQVAKFVDDSSVVCGGWGRTVRLWRLPQPEVSVQKIQHERWVNKIVFSRSGRIAASADEAAVVWDVGKGRPLCQLTPLADYKVQDIDISPDEQWLITAVKSDKATRGAIVLWNAQSGKQMKWIDMPAVANRVVVSPDGRQLLVIYRNQAQVWTTSGEVVTPLLKHGNQILQGEFSPSGKRIVTTSFDNTAQTWDAASGKLLQTFKHNTRVDRARFSSDGNWLVSVCSGEGKESSARIWNSRTGEETVRVVLAVAYILDVAFDASANRFATAGSDGIARVWNRTTGKAVSPPLVHQAMVQCVAFDATSRMLVTASWDKTARVWDAATGMPLTAPLRHGDWVMGAAFGPNGKWVGTAARDGLGRLWNLSPTEKPAEQLSLLAQILSGHRVDATGGLVRLQTEELKRAYDRLQAK